MMRSSLASAAFTWMKSVAPNAHLCADSRLVKNGDIFFAFPIPNSTGDGRQYIQDAIKNGAVAIVFEEDNFQWNEKFDVPHYPVNDLIWCVGWIVNQWFDAPDQNMYTVAVTGTNGKTSCSQWIAKAFSMTGTPCAVIGTQGVGVYRNGHSDLLVETGFTTPDAIQLQGTLAKLRNDGAQAMAIEASSIGLHQGRLNGLHIDVALMTNLTRDHLDYHHTMEIYAQSKTILFDWQNLRTAVINLDDAYGVQLVEHISQKSPDVQVIGYSLAQEGHSKIQTIIASQMRTTSQGTSFYVESPFGAGQIKTQMIGGFNVSNVLGVLGVLFANGIAWEIATNCIEQLHAVPGRMQQLGSHGQAMVVVDYAHTPDALEKTLMTLQLISQERGGELWCVFGCGGDRDSGKRPQMGKISQMADHVVITNDNPRTENPQKIIQEITMGMDRTPQIIEDRASAILFAVKHASTNDVILLAGKGHESYQEIDGKKWEFSDIEHAQLALTSVATNGSMRRST